jgi:hypothetical protein
VSKINAALLSLLEVSSHAKDLLLAGHGDHIRRRRRESAPEIIRGIPAALVHVTHVGYRCSERGVRHVVVGRSDIGKKLLVVLEFRPAESAPTGKDEAWVVTAYYVDDKELRRSLGKKLLRQI